MIKALRALEKDEAFCPYCKLDLMFDIGDALADAPHGMLTETIKCPWCRKPIVVSVELVAQFTVTKSKEK